MLEHLTRAARRLDDAVDRAFDRVRGNPVADRIFYGASAAGEFSLIWHSIGVARALLPSGRLVDAVRLSSLLGLESLLVNGVVKSLVRRERPTHESDRPHDLRIPLTSSFPSGHASAAFMAAGLLGERDRRLTPVFYGLAAIVASSRVHVRIHHGSDVAAGALLGMGLAKLAPRLWPPAA